MMRGKDTQPTPPDEPEVLPPEPPARSNSSHVRNLTAVPALGMLEDEASAPQDPYMYRVMMFHQAAKKLSKGSILCAAMAGATMLQKKSSMPHGRGFTKWKHELAALMGVSGATADRYMALTKVMDKRIRYMLARNPEADLSRRLVEEAASKRFSEIPGEAQEDLALTGPGALNTIDLLASMEPANYDEIVGSAVAEAVREVAPVDTLRQLYLAWDIVKRPKRKGGARAKGESDLTEEAERAMRTEAAREMWDSICKQLEHELFKRREPDWPLLPQDEREGLVVFLRGCADHVSKSIPRR